VVESLEEYYIESVASQAGNQCAFAYPKLLYRMS